MKCKTPMRCRPEFEGKAYCKRCAQEHKETKGSEQE